MDKLNPCKCNLENTVKDLKLQSHMQIETGAFVLTETWLKGNLSDELILLNVLTDN